MPFPPLSPPCNSPDCLLCYSSRSFPALITLHFSPLPFSTFLSPPSLLNCNSPDCFLCYSSRSFPPHITLNFSPLPFSAFLSSPHEPSQTSPYSIHLVHFLPTTPSPLPYCSPSPFSSPQNIPDCSPYSSSRPSPPRNTKSTPLLFLMPRFLPTSLQSTPYDSSLPSSSPSHPNPLPSIPHHFSSPFHLRLLSPPSICSYLPVSPL